MDPSVKGLLLLGAGAVTIAALSRTGTGSRSMLGTTKRYGDEPTPTDLFAYWGEKPEAWQRVKDHPDLRGGTFRENPMHSWRTLWEEVLADEGKNERSTTLNVNKFSARNRARLAAWKPDLDYYDLILVNTSGGKDSAAMIAKICELTRAPSLHNRMLAIHSDLGEAEHPKVKQVVEQHSRRTNMPVVIIEPTIKGQISGLIEQVEKRAKSIERQQIARKKEGKPAQRKKHAAPGIGTRYCTSALKTGNIKKWITNWIRGKFGPSHEDFRQKYGRRIRILNLLGLRAGEGALRAKAAFKYKADYTNKTRMVAHEWLPIQFYTTKQVWEAIRTAQLPYHSAYQVGFGRLSCSICPLAGRDDLALGMLVYPELAEKMFALEDRYGFKWKETVSAKQIYRQARKNPSLVAKAQKARAQLRLRQGGPRMWLSTQTVGDAPVGAPYTPQV